MEKLTALLKEINLEDQILEAYGFIDYIEVDERNKTWFFSFVFDKVIPILHFRHFIKQLNQLKSLYPSVESIDFKLKFNEIDGEILDYYDYAIDLLAEDDKRITPLKEYPKDLEDQVIKIYVPKGAVTPAIYRNIIENQLKKLGFDFSIQVLIDESQTSIEEDIHNQTQVFVEQHNNLLGQESIEYIYLNESNNIHEFHEINELPKSDMDLEEHKERNGGKALFNVKGICVFAEIDESNNKATANFIITNQTDSVYVMKRNIRPTDMKFYKDIEVGMGLIVKSFGMYDNYKGETVLHIINIAHSNKVLPKDLRMDQADIKRVELHMHTKMSALDGVADVREYLERAKKWGHTAFGVSDTGSVQAFPILEGAIRDSGVKPIYGLELTFVDDEAITITRGEDNRLLSEATFVVFDIETTGLSLNHDELIEMGAIKVKNGAILGEFGEWINPGVPISPFTTQLTGITQSMVNGKRSVKPVLEDFYEFSKNCILIAHNAEFDLGFLDYNYRKYGITNHINPSIDTLNLAKVLIPERTRFGLDALSKYFKVRLDQHHRAVNDAKATFEIFLHLLKILRKNGFNKFQDLNLMLDKNEVYEKFYDDFYDWIVSIFCS